MNCVNRYYQLITPDEGQTRRTQFCPSCPDRGRESCWSADARKAFIPKCVRVFPSWAKIKCAFVGCDVMVWKHKGNTGLCRYHASEKRQRQREAERHAREAQQAQEQRITPPRFRADRVASRIIAATTQGID